jgi:hypothetical protein
VSFWRIGAENWAEARHNIALAAGDELYVGSRSVIELKAGGRAFVRADSDTQLSLLTHTADFLQFRITTGRVSFDLRTLPTGYTVEVNAPNAVLTIDRSGYYRVGVDGEVNFITRRGWDDTPHRLTHTTQTWLQPVRGALPVKPEPAQPRAVEQQERQRVPAEPPRAAPAPTRQPERAELPGKPANGVYCVPQRENEDHDQRHPQDGR